MLNVASNKMTDIDQILAILNGFGDEYESIIATVCSNEIPYTLLMSHEGRILQKSSTIELSTNFSIYKKIYNWGSQNNNQGGRGTNGSCGRGRDGSSYNNNNRTT